MCSTFKNEILTFTYSAHRVHMHVPTVVLCVDDTFIDSTKQLKTFILFYFLSYLLISISWVCLTQTICSRFSQVHLTICLKNLTIRNTEEVHEYVFIILHYFGDDNNQYNFWLDVKSPRIHSLHWGS